MIEDYIGYEVTNIKLQLRDGKISVEIGVDPEWNPDRFVGWRSLDVYKPKWLTSQDILRDENEFTVIRYYNHRSFFKVPWYSDDRDGIEVDGLQWGHLLKIERINHKRPKKVADRLEFYSGDELVCSLCLPPMRPDPLDISHFKRRSRFETIITIDSLKQCKTCRRGVIDLTEETEVYCEKCKGKI